MFRGRFGYLCRYRDFALVGELDGIAYEIDDDLPQPPRVASQAPRSVRLNAHTELEILALRRVRQYRHRAFNALLQVEFNVFKQKFSGLDLGKIEDIVDEAEEVLR